MWLRALGASQTLTASAYPFRHPARASTGMDLAASSGEVSAVITKWPARSAASSCPLERFNATAFIQ
jgi:hypothetical protein